jgi:hypothetical protein
MVTGGRIKFTIFTFLRGVPQRNRLFVRRKHTSGDNIKMNVFGSSVAPRSKA